MKLLNVNVGIRIDNSNKIAEYIKKVKPEFIAIQEIVRHLEDSVHKQFHSKKGIESLLGDRYPYKFFGPLWVTDGFRRKDGKDFTDFGGHIEQGNEILSKFPFVEATNEHYYKHYSYALDWTNWEKEDHGRALQVAELDVDGKKLQILNIHGIWTKDKQGDDRTMAECGYVVDAAKRKDIPTIITGDFNLLPDTDSIGVISKDFRNLIEEYKIKTTRPDFKDDIDEGRNVVDYMFVNEGIEVIDFKVEETEISDHLPLLLEFKVI